MEIAAASEARIAMASVWVHRDLIHREAVPLPLRGEGLNATQIGARLALSGATLPLSGERSVAALPDRGRVLSFTSAGGAKPIAGKGGLEGFTPPHN